MDILSIYTVGHKKVPVPLLFLR